MNFVKLIMQRLNRVVGIFSFGCLSSDSEIYVSKYAESDQAALPAVKVCIQLPCHVLLGHLQWRADLTMLCSQHEFMMSAEAEGALRDALTN